MAVTLDDVLTTAAEALKVAQDTKATLDNSVDKAAATPATQTTAPANTPAAPWWQTAIKSPLLYLALAVVAALWFMSSRR